MNKIYKGQVNQLRKGLINQIKLTFITPDVEDTEIEFTEGFQIWLEAKLLFSTEYHKVLCTVTGLKIINGECFITGLDYNQDELKDLELEEIWDLYELAHILDALTAGHYKILTNG